MKNLVVVSYAEDRHLIPVLDGDDKVKLFDSINQIEAIFGATEEEMNILGMEIFEIAYLIPKIMPHGSGFDSDFQFNDKFANGKYEFLGGYHCMNEGGFYDGWINIRMIVSPEDGFDFKIHLSGRKKYIPIMRDYIDETIEWAFTENGFRLHETRSYARWVENRNGIIQKIRNETKKENPLPTQFGSEDRIFSVNPVYADLGKGKHLDHYPKPSDDAIALVMTERDDPRVIAWSVYHGKPGAKMWVADLATEEDATAFAMACAEAHSLWLDE